MAAGWQPALMSVVVPTYNRAPTLARVLAACADQTLPPDQFEVIVVDDGSTDATATTLAAAQAQASYRLLALTQANQGPAAARNRGLAAARGTVVVFVDDDCLPTPGLLAAHRAAHEVEGLAVIGRITWHPDLPVTPLMGYLERSIFSYDHIRLPLDAPFTVYYTGNASVHRASALAIGGFDELFPRAMHEDIDFAYRLRRHGVRLVFAPEAVVLHDRPADLPATLANQRGKGREMLRFWRKHPELHEFTPLPRLPDPSVTDDAIAACLAYASAAGAEPDPDVPPTPTVSEPEAPAPRLSALLAERARLRGDVRWLNAVVAAQAARDSEHAAITAALDANATQAAALERQVLQARDPDVATVGARMLTELAISAGTQARRFARRLVRPSGWPGRHRRRQERRP